MRTIIIIYLITISITGICQQEPQFTLFDNNFSLFNPGETGIKSKYNAAITHRNQWIETGNNPVTTTANFNMRIEEYKSGIGIAFMRDALESHISNRAYLNYAYHLKVRDELNLGLGAGAFFNNMVFDFDTVVYVDNRINFNGGAFLYNKRFEVGLGATQINEAYYSSSEYNAALHLFINCGYLVNLSNSFKWKINTLIKTDIIMNVIDLNNRFIYKGIYWTGFTLRSTGAYGLQAGIIIKDIYKIGYSYDRLGGIMPLITHEFILSFNMN